MGPAVDSPQRLGSKKLRRIFLEGIGRGRATIYTTKARVPCIWPDWRVLRKGLRGPEVLRSTPNKQG